MNIRIHETSNSTLIPLASGGFTEISSEDAERVNAYTWTQSTKGYAVSTHLIEGYSKSPGKRGNHIALHRLLFDFPKGMDIDHINGNTLDNRRENLRVATRQQNARNRSSKSHSNSGHIGVSWHKRIGKWRAYISVPEQTHLGYFSELQEAIKAREDAEIKHFGEWVSR